MSLRIVKPGLLSSVQDRGRRGHAALGVGHAGAIDLPSLAIANALVGNTAGAAALEMTVVGAVCRFERATRIALCGAEIDARLDARTIGGWQAIDVQAGQTLDCTRFVHGARACLAVRGGFAVARALGSASADLNAGIGPRALAAGDRLDFGDATTGGASDGFGEVERGHSSDHRGIRSGRAGDPREVQGGRASDTWEVQGGRASDRRHIPFLVDSRRWFDADVEVPLRLMRGRHHDALDAASRRALFGAPFRVARDSNRVGLRLEGPVLHLAQPLELVSEAVTDGSLQLPPGGQPIMLMAEHPTTGGYPRIGQLAAADLARLGQRRPGDPVRFVECSLDEAIAAERRQRIELDLLLTAIRERVHR
ncbi:MAG: biotin-dependent carboxyltransferase family protein [Xanthomonadales bacterium]|nr:biotin-dependent carboxyltransferase family protein [Xanthomonadales bacterium]